RRTGSRGRRGAAPQPGAGAEEGASWAGTGDGRGVRSTEYAVRSTEYAVRSTQYTVGDSAVLCIRYSVLGTVYCVLLPSPVTPSSEWARRLLLSPTGGVQ